MGKPHKHAEVIHAIADGEIVQFKVADKWMDFVRDKNLSPIERPDLKWRIKPETKPDVVFYVNANFERAKSGEIYSTTSCHHCDNIKLTFDGETGKLKSAEVLK